MLNINFPKFEKKDFQDLTLNLVEPINKINLRGKNRDFFAKAGKILSIMLPTDPNTSATIKNISAVWLSPDEWMVYGKDIDKNISLSLDNEISKLNLGSVTDVSDQWILINMKGKNVFDVLSKGSPFNFNKFKSTKNIVVQTLLNHVDVILHQNDLNNVNLFVRKSFSEHLWLWINDSSSFL
tara:strand:- start:1274 stop:1819 length:546 start_codon:yes stop_codon:yes gene_type:complete